MNRSAFNSQLKMKDTTEIEAPCETLIANVCERYFNRAL